MIDVRLPFLLSLFAASASADGAPQRPDDRPRTRSMIIQQQLIIRVPRMPLPRPERSSRATLPPIEWAEKKAAKCIPTTSVVTAAITRADSVDLVLNGGKRLRARLESDCPALDFYSGFYMKLAPDGQFCAKRDTIRSRSGGECRIQSFRALVPKH